MSIKNYLKSYYFRHIYYKGKGLIISKKAHLNSKNIFEEYTVIQDNVRVENSSIGLGTYISANSVIKRTSIGRFCSIGQNVQTSLGIHPSSIFVSTHPAFFSPMKQAGFSFVNRALFEEHSYLDEKYCIKIGNDVWIGNDVMIMDGITIGDGAIIGAGAIVTRDVEKYSIVAGIPAKHKKFRFTEDEIQFLDKIKWWDKDFNWVQLHARYFSDIKNLQTVLKETEIHE